MCSKIWCDGESWKFFSFWDELNKALHTRSWCVLKLYEGTKAFFGIWVVSNFLESPFLRCVWIYLESEIKMKIYNSCLYLRYDNRMLFADCIECHSHYHRCHSHLTHKYDASSMESWACYCLRLSESVHEEAVDKLRPCLVPTKNQKLLKIFRHIKFYDTYMK